MDKDAVIATLRAHRAELERLGVRHAALFGSLARGEARPDSDIDIAVDLDETNLPGVYAFVGLADYVGGLFPVQVDVVDKFALERGPAKAALGDFIYAF